MFGERKMPTWVQTPKANGCRANLKEIEALPQRERERLAQRMRELGSRENPPGFHRRP